MGDGVTEMGTQEKNYQYIEIQTSVEEKDGSKREVTGKIYFFDIESLTIDENTGNFKSSILTAEEQIKDLKENKGFDDKKLEAMVNEYAKNLNSKDSAVYMYFDPDEFIGADLDDYYSSKIEKVLDAKEIVENVIYFGEYLTKFNIPEIKAIMQHEANHINRHKFISEIFHYFEEPLPFQKVDQGNKSNIQILAAEKENDLNYNEGLEEYYFESIEKYNKSFNELKNFLTSNDISINNSGDFYKKIINNKENLKEYVSILNNISHFEQKFGATIDEMQKSQDYNYKSSITIIVNTIIATEIDADVNSKNKFDLISAFNKSINYYINENSIIEEKAFKDIVHPPLPERIKYLQQAAKDEAIAEVNKAMEDGVVEATEWNGIIDNFKEIVSVEKDKEGNYNVTVKNLAALENLKNLKELDPELQKIFLNNSDASELITGYKIPVNFAEGFEPKSLISR